MYLLPCCAFLYDRDTVCTALASLRVQALEQVHLDCSFHFPRGLQTFTITQRDLVLPPLDHNSSSHFRTTKPSLFHLERISRVQPSSLPVLSVLQLSQTRRFPYCGTSSYLDEHLGIMASYQSADHNTNRRPTPTMKALDDLDDGKTPRASAKVNEQPPKAISTNPSQACQYT